MRKCSSAFYSQICRDEDTPHYFTDHLIKDASFQSVQDTFTNFL